MKHINSVLAENPLLISSANHAQGQTSTSTLKTNNPTKQAEEKTSSPSTQPEIREKHIETLFIRFASIYGHYWLNTYQNERVLNAAKKEWLESLSAFKGKYIKEALQLIKKQNHYPPSLPMFVDCCKAIEARYKPSIHATGFEKKSTPEVVNHNISKMKEYLRKR